MKDTGEHYLLGHSESELRRLDLQGDLYRDITRRAFVQAGIGPGMHVLDIGCGTGDVSMVAADVVGPDGRVLGIDRSEQAVAAARAKARRLGLEQAHFERHEIARFERPSAFDAVVGRFVLMHQAEPAELLGSVAGAVRADGIVVMIESYMEVLRGGVHSEPHSALYDRIVRFKCDVVHAAGADLRAGGRLRSTFVSAGLPAPACRMETRLEGGAGSRYYEYVAESVRSMLPEAERSGVPGFSSEDVDDLERRLRDEVVSADGVLVAWPAVVAHARLGAANATRPEPRRPDRRRPR